MQHSQVTYLKLSGRIEIFLESTSSGNSFDCLFSKLKILDSVLSTFSSIFDFETSISLGRWINGLTLAKSSSTGRIGGGLGVGNSSSKSMTISSSWETGSGSSFGGSLCLQCS